MTGVQTCALPISTTSLATATVKKTVVVDEDVPFTESKPVASKKAPIVEDDDEDLAMFKELADLDD